MVRLGQGSYVGLGLLTYGTVGAAADIDMYFQVGGDADSLQAERDRIEFDDLTSDFQHVTAMVGGHRRATGPLKLKMTYGGAQDLMRAITGHNVAPTGTNPYTYAFVPVSRGSASNYIFGTTARGWVIEVFRGGTAVNSTFYQSCIITSAKFSFRPNSYVDVELQFLSRSFTRTAKSASPTYKTDRIKTPTGQAGNALVLGGTGQFCHSCDIEINLAVDGRYDLTAQNMSQPLPNAKQMVKVSAEIEVDDDSFLDRLDDPEGSRFTSGSLTITDGSKQLLFTFDELLLDSPAEPRATSVGVVKTSLSLTAQAATVTGQAYTVTVINTESAYST